MPIVIITDSFNRADANPAGAPWTTAPGASAGLKILSNAATGTVAGGDDHLAYYSGLPFPANQYSEVVLAASGDGGPACRILTTGITKNAYYAVANRGDGHVYLSKYVANTSSDIGSAVATAAIGDTLRVTANGTTISVQLNGTTIISVTDSSLTIGSAGIQVWDNATFSADSWVGGSPDRIVFIGSSTTVEDLSSTPDVILTGPSNIQSGDFLLAIASIDHCFEPGFTVPIGWSEYTTPGMRNPGLTSDNWGADGQSAGFFYKFAGGSEPSTYTFAGVDGTFGGQNAWQLRVYRGVETSNPFHAFAKDLSAVTLGTGTGITLTTPTISTTADGCMILSGFTPDAEDGNQGSITYTSGWSNGVHAGFVPADSAALWAFVDIADQYQATQGTTSACTMGYNDLLANRTPYNNGNWQLALLPTILVTTFEQVAFRWRNDDGSETTATWNASQGTNISLVPSVIKRLRFLIQTGAIDPAALPFQVEYRRVGDSAWFPLKKEGDL